MTPGYLTTDIIVIIVLVVVLVLVGVCAFFTHFYWTKIGVADIWNTAKWSSMRSNVYQTIRRFSQASSKYGSERPFSAASAYSDGSDGTALPAPLRNKKSNNAANAPSPAPPAAATTSAPPPANAHSSVSSQNHSSDNSGRRNSRNQVQPVSTVSYNNLGTKNYGIKIGQPLESTKIHNVHEQGDRRTDGSVVIETHRF